MPEGPHELWLPTLLHTTQDFYPSLLPKPLFLSLPPPPLSLTQGYLLTRQTPTWDHLLDPLRLLIPAKSEQTLRGKAHLDALQLSSGLGWSNVHFVRTHDDIEGF